jgi:hypothetical protein
MGYGYAETFLIVFLTHPGVLIPTTGAAGSKALSFVPENIKGAIPSDLTDMVKDGVFPAPISALWQVLWVWILSLPGNRGPAFGWTMYSLYIVFLLLYMYFFLRLRMTFGV